MIHSDCRFDWIGRHPGHSSKEDTFECFCERGTREADCERHNARLNKMVKGRRTSRSPAIPSLGFQVFAINQVTSAATPSSP